LVDVLAELDNGAHLTIIGDGPLKGELVDLARERGVLERLHFTGLLPRDEVYVALDEADIFVSSAKWEGLPIAVLEAMVVGLPVMLSDIPPHRELVIDQRGATIMSADTKDWKVEIENLTIDELEKRGNMCREIAEKNFSLQKMHKGYDRVYKKLWSAN